MIIQQALTTDRIFECSGITQAEASILLFGWLTERAKHMRTLRIGTNTLSHPPRQESNCLTVRGMTSTQTVVSGALIAEEEERLTVSRARSWHLNTGCLKRPTGETRT